MFCYCFVIVSPQNYRYWAELSLYLVLYCYYMFDFLHENGSNYLLDHIYIMYFQYESDLFYENVTHLVRLQMNFVHIFYLLS